MMKAPLKCAVSIAALMASIGACADDAANLAELFEKGDWDGVNEVATSLNISMSQINDFYRQAIEQTSARMAHI